MSISLSLVAVFFIVPKTVFTADLMAFSSLLPLTFFKASNTAAFMSFGFPEDLAFFASCAPLPLFSNRGSSFVAMARANTDGYDGVGNPLQTTSER